MYHNHVTVSVEFMYHNHVTVSEKTGNTSL